ncbi:hypothetical protein BDN72DRAFT_894579 [Pluteus cervinus]|uniref:Uncharacterized protein n=1 Tax=Pluteus cervinus TaxID=181527 RepID=A0ACD3B706_9AGAR|nr:hypothetical protein BDN72DRAFT_894579 [Pluteus cervinus]
MSAPALPNKYNSPHPARLPSLQHSNMFNATSILHIICILSILSDTNNILSRPTPDTFSATHVLILLAVSPAFFTVITRFHRLVCPVLGKLFRGLFNSASCTFMDLILITRFIVKVAFRPILSTFLAIWVVLYSTFIIVNSCPTSVKAVTKWIKKAVTVESVDRQTEEDTHEDLAQGSSHRDRVHIGIVADLNVGITLDAAFDHGAMGSCTTIDGCLVLWLFVVMVFLAEAAHYVTLDASKTSLFTVLLLVLCKRGIDSTENAPKVNIRINRENEEHNVVESPFTEARGLIAHIEFKEPDPSTDHSGCISPWALNLIWAIIILLSTFAIMIVCTETSVINIIVHLMEEAVQVIYDLLASYGIDMAYYVEFVYQLSCILATLKVVTVLYGRSGSEATAPVQVVSTDIPDSRASVNDLVPEVTLELAVNEEDYDSTDAPAAAEMVSGIEDESPVQGHTIESDIVITTEEHEGENFNSDQDGDTTSSDKTTMDDANTSFKVGLNISSQGQDASTDIPRASVDEPIPEVAREDAVGTEEECQKNAEATVTTDLDDFRSDTFIPFQHKPQGEDYLLESAGITTRDSNSKDGNLNSDQDETSSVNIGDSEASSELGWNAIYRRRYLTTDISDSLVDGHVSEVEGPKSADAIATIGLEDSGSDVSIPFQVEDEPQKQLYPMETDAIVTTQDFSGESIYPSSNQDGDNGVEANAEPTKNETQLENEALHAMLNGLKAGDAESLHNFIDDNSSPRTTGVLLEDTTENQARSASESRSKKKYRKHRPRPQGKKQPESQGDTRG